MNMVTLDLLPDGNNLKHSILGVVLAFGLCLWVRMSQFSDGWGNPFVRDAWFMDNPDDA